MRKSAMQAKDKPYNRLLLSILGTLSFVGNSLATTYYVRITGNDANNGKSSAAAFKTIDKAANTAAAGDTIYVGGGTYTGDVSPANNGTSANPIKCIGDTTGAYTGDAGTVTISGKQWNQGSKDYWQISGLTISGDTSKAGFITSGCTGWVIQNCTVTGRLQGIAISGTTTATISNCLCYSNADDGIQVNSGNAATVANVNNCALYLNTKNGIYFKKCSGTIKNCIIVYNQDEGIWADNDPGTLPTIWNCTISDNTNSGLKVSGGTSTIKNCALTYNGAYGLNKAGGTLNNSYNDVYGNTTANFNGCTAGTGGISSDPKYTNRPNDYTLLPTSPMINAGTSGSGTVDDDLNSNLRPIGPAWDMGCYECPKNGKVLLVATSTTSPTSNEVSRRLKIQGFDMCATYIDDDDTQANYNTAIAANDVAYVTSDISAASLGNKLTSAAFGIVNENTSLAASFGFATSASNSAGSSISIVSNYHYITSSFGLGASTIFSSSQPNVVLNAPVTKDLQVLATWNDARGLAVLESGSRRYDSGNVAGRRVQLPWGGSTFAVSALNSNGDTIMKGAIQWAEGLVAYWKLNESSGTAAADSGPHGYNGTVTGTATWQTSSGKLNGDLSLNGATYVQATGLMGSPANATLAGWANCTAVDTTAGDFISIADCFKIRFTSSNVQARFYDGSTLTSATYTGSYVGAGWHHFAAVFDDDNNVMTLYIDGASAATLSTTSSISYSGLGSNTQIGHNAQNLSGYNFTGQVDDVRVYNYALSADEVRNLRYVGQPRGMKVIKWVETQ
jgi:hypothetical protein